jgi:cobalt-zinc-cadmium efflux system membrane fusion protein
MKRRLLGVAGVVLAVPMLSWGAQQVQLSPEEQARAGLLVRPVLTRTFGDQIRVVGLVVRAPGSTVTVKTVVGGRVEGILAMPGTAVKRGQPLLTLHSHELRHLQSELLKAAEHALLAQSRLKAGEELLEIQGISRIDLERRRQEALEARLALQAVRAELLDLGYSEKDLEDLQQRSTPDPHLTVYSPAPGVVLSLGVEEHEWVEAYAPLVVIGDPGRVELKLQIPPDQASRIAAGDRVEFVPVGRPDLAGRGEVLTSVPEVDQTTRTIVIRVKIVQAATALVPGVFVEGTLTHGSARSAPSVPEAAVSRVGGEDVVFVKLASELFEVRPLKLGAFNGTRYEVLSGVDEGEQVVVRGAFFLKSKLLSGGEEGEE